MKTRDKYLNEGFYEDDNINQRFATADKAAKAIRKDFKNDILALINKMNKKYPDMFKDTPNNTVFAISEALGQLSLRTKGR